MAEEIKEVQTQETEVKETNVEESTVNNDVKDNVTEETDTKTEVKDNEQKVEEKVIEKKEEPEVEIKYDFKFPDGIKVEEAEIAKLKEISKEMKLSNEQAQKFVDFTASQVKFFSKKSEQDFIAMKEGWVKQSKELYTDEQIGNAGKVAREIGGDKFVELLETTGLANNPLVVGFLEKVSANYTNDKLVIGKTSGGEPTEKQILDMTYPNTK